MPCPVEQSVLSGKITRKEKGSTEQEPCSACNENRRQFNDAVGKNKGPEGDAQAMGVTEACKSADHEAIEDHQVEGPETKGHSQGKGEETDGNVVGHDPTGGQGLHSENGVEPDRSLFHLLNQLRGHDESDKAAV